jgi:formylmethanofuran dehydrogenase subunit C
MWAIISYIIVLVIASHTQLGSDTVENQALVVPVNDVITPENITTKSLEPIPITSTKKKITTQNMKNGYYILNEAESLKKGVPKYIYLGPEAPNLSFHSSTMEEGEE